MERLQNLAGERVVAAERFSFNRIRARLLQEREPRWGGIWMIGIFGNRRVSRLRQHRSQTLRGLGGVGRGGIALQVILPESDRLCALGAEKFSKLGIGRGNKRSEEHTSE